jgi:DNA-binding CsgD family transcriptional regulator
VNAIEVDNGCGIAPLAAVWTGFAAGSLVFHSSHWGRDVVSMIARNVATGQLRATPAHTLLTLEQVLCGIPQKAVAIDSRMSGSNVHCTVARCLSLWGFPGALRAVSPVLVAAAHAFSAPNAVARFAVYEPSPETGTVRFAIDRPELALANHLSPAEYEVARLCVEGHSHKEIAWTRRASTRTIANQFGCIRRKLGAGGRLGLLGVCARLTPQPRRLGVRAAPFDALD